MTYTDLVQKVIVPDELARVYSDESYYAPFPAEFNGCLVEASPGAEDVTEIVRRAVANALGAQLFEIKTAIHHEISNSMRCAQASLCPSDERTIHSAQLNAYNKVLSILLNGTYKPENAGKGVNDAEF